MLFSCQRGNRIWDCCFVNTALCTSSYTPLRALLHSPAASILCTCAPTNTSRQKKKTWSWRRMMEQVAQRNCGISICQDFENLNGQWLWATSSCSETCPVLSKGLDLCLPKVIYNLNYSMIPEAHQPPALFLSNEIFQELHAHTHSLCTKGKSLAKLHRHNFIYIYVVKYILYVHMQMYVCVDLCSCVCVHMCLCKCTYVYKYILR